MAVQRDPGAAGAPQQGGSLTDGAAATPGAPPSVGDYSEIAEQQLDEIEAGPDPALYNAVLDTCEEVLDHPGRAQARSSVVATKEGMRLRVPVTGFYPMCVFWSSNGPRIEAVFPYGR